MNSLLNNLKLYISSFLILVILISCEESAEESSTNIQERGLITKSLEHDGITRTYIIYIPNSYDESVEHPLMFNFHGFGGRAADFVYAADMRSQAERDKFIIVYPQGSLLGGFPHWNSSGPSPDNKSSADDIGFVEQLITKISMDYSVNADRIYAAGFSNGAFFSYYLACNTDKFAAIGSVAGTMIDDSFQNCNALIPTGMINIHGTADSVVPYNGDGVGATSINDVLEYWRYFNLCTVIKETNDSSYGPVTQYNYYDDNGGLYVQHYKETGGGHYWSKGLTFNGKNTNDLVWDFVSKFDINGIID